LALFQTNVKVCKFLCKYSKIANNIAHLPLRRSEAFSPHIYISLADGCARRANLPFAPLTTPAIIVDFGTSAIS
jgi:hypothetical protein